MPIQQITSGIISDNAVVAADIADGTLTGAKLAANTLANSVFQTGSVENYMRAQGTFAGMRNKIINGAMMVDQRANSASITPTDPGYQSLDRYYLSLSSSSKFSIQQNAGSVTPPVGFSKYLGITSLSAFAVGTSEYFQLQQLIEGQNIVDLAWGTANAKPITISFWVRSSLTGTFGGSIRNSGDTYGYCYSYTISSANTWEYKTITVAGPTSGTWLTTNGVGIDFRFCFGMGTANQGATGSWGGSSAYAPTGQVSIVGTNGATWYITGLQIEAGSTPTPFDYRQYGTELALCQRYYQRSYDLGVATGTVVAGPVSGSWQYNQPSFFIGTGNYGMNCGTPFPVLMRAIPTITVYSPSSGTAGSVTPWNGSDYTLISSGGFVNASTSRITGGGYNNATTSGLVYGFQWTASAEL
jgi:hypothetical protein